MARRSSMSRRVGFRWWWTERRSDSAGRCVARAAEHHPRRRRAPSAEARRGVPGAHGPGLGGGIGRQPGRHRGEQPLVGPRKARREKQMIASASVATRRPSLASSTAVIARRSLLKFLRTPQLVWTTTVQGVMFLIIFRYIFGGAIGAGQLGYVDFVVPGILTTMLIWQGMGAAVSITEDHAQGLFDRLRSLPIPRSAVLSGRAVADTAMLLWGLVIMTIVSFLIGFRLHGGFMTTGLYARNAQAAQGVAQLLVPFTFVSSAYVPVASMPSGLRSVAAHQPVTYMIDAVRTLTGGARAEALLGHPASYFVARSLIWSAVIVIVFATIGVARYRRG